MALGKLMKNLTKKIVRWALLNDAEKNKTTEDNTVPVGSSKISNSIRDMSNGMNFSVYHATGGKVIHFSTYDPRTDRNKSELYVITDRENLGEELSLIITKESLTR